MKKIFVLFFISFSCFAQAVKMDFNLKVSETNNKSLKSSIVTNNQQEASIQVDNLKLSLTPHFLNDHVIEIKGKVWKKAGNKLTEIGNPAFVMNIGETAVMKVENSGKEIYSLEINPHLNF